MVGMNVRSNVNGTLHKITDVSWSEKYKVFIFTLDNKILLNFHVFADFYRIIAAQPCMNPTGATNR